MLIALADHRQINQGDYWNLQSGAEVGLYKYNKQLSDSAGKDHYDAVDFEVPMTLSLYNYQNSGTYENVFHWAPTVPQWWITGFNPRYTKPNPEKMIPIASVDLSGHGVLYKAIANAKGANYHGWLQTKHLIFDETRRTVWIQWYNEGIA